jgi:4-amino-4-deoxy-L-arabinose transferase-like glycosyltransferase
MRRARLFGWPLAVAMVVVYAGLLRFDALVGKYGLVEGPPWVDSVVRLVAEVADGVSPPAFVWRTAGERHGDPKSYLKIARGRETFYEAGAREPLFLATIQAFLWLTGDQDIAVNLASLTYSVLLVLATCLLGAAAFSPVVGLVAGAFLALDATTIGQGATGWRDDAFAFFTVSTAWALVRLRSRHTIGHACAAAAFAAGACLVRLSALSFVVPAFVVAALDRGENRRGRLPYVIAAAVLAAAIVAPFMVGNAMVFDDPFYSVDFATEFYRGRAEAPVEQPLAAGGVLVAKLMARPLETLDVLVPGFLAYPFRNKWQGLEYLLSPPLATALSAAAIAGLLLFLRSAEGRLMLVVLFGALVPFAAIWQTRTGAQWRFTLFAYPFYLIAACEAFRAAAAFAREAYRRRGVAAPRWSRVAAVFVLGLFAVGAVRWFPSLWRYLVMREVAASEGEYSIVAGQGDRVFFADGWYPPVSVGAATGRYSRGANARVWVPIFAPGPFRLTFRMQACAPDEAPARDVRLSVDGVDVGGLQVVWDAERARDYVVELPSLSPGWHRIDLRAEGSSVIPAGETRYTGLEAGADTALFLLFVRVRDSRASASAG